MPDAPESANTPERAAAPGSTERTDPPELTSVADLVATQTRAYLSTITEVAAGANPDAAISLLLLAVSDVLSAGARLGAMVDVVPVERFEPDLGAEADLDPLRAGLANAFEGIDDYAEVSDPLLDPQLATASISGDLVLVAGALTQGLRHYEGGRPIEALWWWQYSYLANWGERAASALRALQVVLAHLRLDVDDDVAAEAEFDALHRPATAP